MRQLKLATFLCLAIGFLNPGMAPRATAAAAPVDSPLNVLVIAVDDLNCNVGCYGHPFARTPNIDRLARHGVRFDRAYCQVALCNPSRTSLLSGRRPDATRIFDNATPPRTTLGPVVFLPEYFRQHGYFTARVGKIAHGAFEQAVAWDVAEDRRPRRGKEKSNDDGAVRPKNKPSDKIPVFAWRRSTADDADLVDGRTALRVVELLREHGGRARGGKPFFIGAGFHKPHLPFVAPRKYFDMFPPSSVPAPERPADRRQFPALALKTTRPDGDRLTEGEVREGIAAYTACTAFVDAQIGVVLRALDELKLWDNTVVVFWGDHGFHLGDHGGLWAKLTVFEQAARVPLIVAAPGRSAGEVSPRLVEMVDLYPTLIDLCGLPPADGLEGTSFGPLLRQPNRPWKTAVFTQVLRDAADAGGGEDGVKIGQGVMGRSVRTEHWRYTEWGGPEVAELYNHDVDPQEMHNLASEAGLGPGARYHQTVVELRRILHGGWRGALPDVPGAGSKRP